jgi:predicted amidophosphoribosyltransferase
MEKVMGIRIEDLDSMRPEEEESAWCPSCKEHFLAGESVCPVCGADFTKPEEINFDDN